MILADILQAPPRGGGGGLATCDSHSTLLHVSLPRWLFCKAQFRRHTSYVPYQTHFRS